MAESNELHPNTEERVAATRLGFSLDWLAVIVAGLLAALVLANLLPAIPW